MTTFPQYCTRVVRYMIKYPDQRLGQAYYNVLYQVKPHTAEYICGTVRDPFHWEDDDDRLEDFLNWLSEEWDK